MSYIACPFCGGGVPGKPCRCGTPAALFDPQPRPPATLPHTQREAELLRRIEELEAALDSAEIEHGLTSNGNLWRFWSKRACDAAKQNSALDAEVARLTAERDALAEALEKIGVFAKGYENNRPGQTGVMSIIVRAVDAALAEQEKDNND